MLEKMTVRDVRNINKINIIKTIISNRDLSRNDIAGINNISVMTVKNIVDDLLRKNVIVEKKVDTSIVGRKPTVLKIADSIGYIITIDLTSSSFLYYVVYDVYKNKVKKGFYRCKKDISFSENIISFVRTIKSEVEQSDILNILGIGISVPGIYKDEEDRIYNELNKDLNNIKLKKIIKENFEVNNIVIDHDVKLAAIAEAIGFNSEIPYDLYYLYIGEGVGGAILLKGEIYNGHNEIAGDIGQLFVDCSSNNRQKLEDVVSCPAIVEGVKRKFNENGLDLGKNSNELDFDDVLKMYKAGDRLVVDYLDNVITCLARAVFNIIWLINPSKIVVDCSYKEFGAIVVDKLNSFVTKMFDSNIPIDFEVNLSKYDENSALIGALELVTNRWIESL
ncbi:MAG TPA: ROK family protein [Clostridiaceae bacterium]|nr:ROK family protein [Clostridiaceae bacterium]